MAKPYLELTKLQRELVFDMIRNQGYAEGVHTLYQRLRRIFGNRPHPAMKNMRWTLENQKSGKLSELQIHTFFCHIIVECARTAETIILHVFIAAAPLICMYVGARTTFRLACLDA